MIYVNQLPVKMKPGENGVQMVFSFGVIANVAPVGRAVRLETCQRGSGERWEETRRGGDGREPKRDVFLFQRREADA